MNKTFPPFILAALAFALMGQAGATPTENLGLQVLPAPGPVVVDGKYADWDLSGSVFASNDIETQRDDYAVWLCAMYDAKNLYFLARFQDKTPLNNPGQTIANYGFAGDSLQIRTITHPDTPGQLTCNLTAWRGASGSDVVNMDYEGAKPEVKDAKTEGGRQAFTVNADGRGYTQEIAIPWALLTKNGQPLRPGDSLQMTFEPNFTLPGKGRLSVKDVFKPVPSIDRIFTFMSKGEWGIATLALKGRQAPRPVRVAGGREFPVTLQNGVPVADWAGPTSSGPAPALPGFKPITFALAEDSYVSLNVKNAQGQVVCHLLRGAFYGKGKHTVLWDGLTTPNAHQPGQPVPPGTYTWSALSHGPISLRLRGFADNGGKAPWDNGPDTNWGGDHGQPNACASEGGRVFLGWTAAEAGAALIATDLVGNVVWKNTRGGIAGAEQVAVTQGIVYVLNGPKDLYHLSAKDGAYLPWGAADSPSAPADVNPLDLWPNAADKPEKIDGLAVMNGQVFLSLTKQNGILVLDAKTGGFVKTISVPAPGRIKADANGRLLVVSGGTSVLSLDPAAGITKTLIAGLTGAASVAVDAQGQVYVGAGDPENQVRVYDAGGKFLRALGRPGGRALLGPWQPDGLRFISDLTVDSAGKLWVTENDDFPKRVSVWDAKTGGFIKEFFGPTHYGAAGGAIDPRDPNLMVGSGCEWRLDPQTGRARCLAVVTRDGMNNSLFGTGTNGRLYLFVANGSGSTAGPVQVFEHLGDGSYALRGRFTYDTQAKTTRYWADANGDGTEQPDEVTTVPGVLKVGGWYMSVTPDLTLYSGYSQYKVVGFTPCGAPSYDLAHPVTLPNAGEQGGMGATAGIGSADGKLILYNGAYAASRSTFDCYDIASGRRLWAYPNDYVGVHGSHNATPPEPGLIRGAYDIVGAATLPAPIGGIWVIPTNVSEWHILTSDGFYLTRLFQPDPMKYQFPAAAPGADMSNAPPGMGGEDFGGSMTLGTDSKLYIQAGKTGYWNLEVTGLETAKAIPGGRLALSRTDIAQADRFQAEEQQIVSGPHSLTVMRLTPTFTGDLTHDFAGANTVHYQKSDDSAATSTASYDSQNLYLAWDVKDNTPWVNGATAPENLYLEGDTVDFQLGIDAHADETRSEAGAGDMRLSLGNFGGKNTAVLYRKVSPVKKPFVFHSGVAANYTMDYVAQVPAANIIVSKRGGGYTVEAAIPLTALGITAQPGQTLAGDFGVTFGDPAGQRTRLRSYWSGQHTGIVDDAVFELMLEPKNWGRLTFEK